MEEAGAFKKMFFITGCSTLGPVYFIIIVNGGMNITNTLSPPPWEMAFWF